MQELLQQLIDRLTTLEDEFDNLPDLSKLIKDIELLKQNEAFTKETLTDAVTMYGNGYISTKSEELFSLLNDTYEKLNKENSDNIDIKANELNDKVLQELSKLIDEYNLKAEQFKKTLSKISNDYQIELDDKVNNALAEINAKLRTVKNGIDGKDGANGKDGAKGNKGDRGLNGNDGVGISDITYKSNTLTIFLSNNTKKEIKLNIPQYLGGGGGGVSAGYVQEAINAALGSALDAYTKAETDALISGAVDDLVNGASNILDSFGEVESVLGTLQTSINANSQAIANLATAQGQFGSVSTQTVTTTEQNLDFNVIIPSTDSNVLALDDTLNRCFFGIDASFNFRTDMNFYINKNAPITVTIRGRNVVDNSLVYSRTVLIHQSTNTSKSVSTNTLLTIGKNGFPSSDLTIYFTIQADDTGIDITDFTSTLTSSSQYDLGTISYTKAESDAKYQAKADENVFIQNYAPTLATGKSALWIDNSDGNITLNLVTGD